MGREIRKVPKDWQHPIDERRGRAKPLRDGADFHKRAQRWLADCAKWETGERPDYAGDDAPRYFWDWDGPPPSEEDYMLIDVPEEQRTHFMLYETTSEGTPHHDCPVFATIEELCEWAAIHASTFATLTATAEEWRRMLDANFVCATSPNAPGVLFL